MENKKCFSGFLSRFLHHGGAGVLAAFVIILIFLICATWLKSLVYGILLTFVLLPMERFYQNKVFRKEEKGWFARLKDRLIKREITEEEEKKILREGRVFKSSLAATLSFFLILLLVLTLSFAFLLPQIQNLKTTVINWGKTSPTVAKVENFLFEEEKKADVEGKENSFTLLRQKLKNLAGENKNVLSVFSVDKGQGVLASIVGLLKGFSMFLLDITLAVFFGFYFLQKIALIQGDEKTRQRKTGEWFVNLFYNSPWLPDVSEKTKHEAVRIITHVSGILIRWIRGYFIVILIEFCLYTLLFTAAGVPYPLLAGSVAGLSILLPFIGPVISFSLTAGLCIAFCEAELFMTLVIVCAIYLLINGLLEQFILYPFFIGQVSGLTTVETIIVVLIGGILAGITGMIFAVPAAAIIKYIIPVIYRASAGDSDPEEKNIIQER